jgi:uncharacterized membrane protein
VADPVCHTSATSLRQDAVCVSRRRCPGGRQLQLYTVSAASLAIIATSEVTGSDGYANMARTHDVVNADASASTWPSGRWD